MSRLTQCMLSASVFELRAPNFFWRAPARLLGVNPRVVPRVDLQLELLPSPYVASRDPSIMQRNIKVALGLLGVPAGSRGYIIVCDETCYHPMIDIVSGLRDEYGYVGCYYHPSDDKSFLSREELKDMKEEHLAKLTQHYVISRCDSNSHVYGIDALPRPQKSLGLRANSAWSTLLEMGTALHNACLANHDEPPISIAYDGAGAHAALNKSLLGAMAPESLQSVPFFKSCKIRRVPLKCFPFHCMYYQDKLPVLGCVDPNHAFKRFSFHLATSSRCASFGEWKVELATLLRGGLPGRAYAATDIQSDADYARKLNAGYLTGRLGVGGNEVATKCH